MFKMYHTRGHWQDVWAVNVACLGTVTVEQWDPVLPCAHTEAWEEKEESKLKSSWKQSCLCLHSAWACAPGLVQTGDAAGTDHSRAGKQGQRAQQGLVESLGPALSWGRLCPSVSHRAQAESAWKCQPSLTKSPQSPWDCAHHVLLLAPWQGAHSF